MPTVSPNRLTKEMNLCLEMLRKAILRWFLNIRLHLFRENSQTVANFAVGYESVFYIKVPAGCVRYWYTQCLKANCVRPIDIFLPVGEFVT